MRPSTATHPISYSKKAFSGIAAAGLILMALIAGPVACVTVNVNFPESAVQKETDDFVRDLYRAKEKGKASPAPSAFLRFNLINEAYAGPAEGNFSVNSAKALQIRDKMSGRVEEILNQKRAGVLGETIDGMLTIKGRDKLKPLLAGKVEKLVADENSDRSDLYAEVARANGLDKGRIKDIQRSFARSFQAESPSGTWVQDPDGKWSQKQ